MQYDRGLIHFYLFKLHCIGQVILPRLRARGASHVAVATKSITTYGEYFDENSVASYLGPKSNHWSRRRLHDQCARRGPWTRLVSK